MQIAERVYSLAKGHSDSALMIGAHRALAITFYFLGDFKSARQHAIRGVEVWRTSEALEVISEAEELAERFENRYWCAELHRLRGVFLAALGRDETQLRHRSAKPLGS